MAVVAAGNAPGVSLLEMHNMDVLAGGCGGRGQRPRRVPTLDAQYECAGWWLWLPRATPPACAYLRCTIWMCWLVAVVAAGNAPGVRLGEGFALPCW